MAVVALPLLLALLHATETLRLPVFDRLDHLIYDARLRATMPRTLDDRIVIVDIDEDSLARVGQWPWGRDRLARFAQEI
ncbi:MAG: CHASE2 domain-containing protein, partial [Burkholderiaceae bacterium]|nr:CHASE2 domain-containing protein [Burkholderiaceae bacterium]